MHDERDSIDRDEQDLARLIAAVGLRSQPSARAASDVRAAVAAEWRNVVAARQQQRRRSTWAAAAGIAALAVTAWLARPLYLPVTGPVATLARVVGDVQLDAGDGRWQSLAAGSVVEPGAVIRTSGDSRAAIELASGVAMRLDNGTQVAFNDVEEASLAKGAVYVDAGPGTGAAAARFVLETPAGDVQHLGTQYEARVDDGVLRVGVREGRVQVSGGHGAVVGSAGELLTVSKGDVTRSALAPNASSWDWVADVTPPFSIEGRTVDEFLTWAARETGRTVVYASTDVARQARSVTLNGTVEGLPPDQAVAAVLSTTSLQPVVSADRIRIEPAP
jgi:ferric-dicitrate binding protein FerR (iron transport regulator)